MTEQILAIGASYGPAGIIIAYMAWQQNKRDDRDDKREARRVEMDQERIEADLAMARAITLLATKVER